MGQVTGIKAGVHSVRKTFNDEETDAVLLVDLSNQFTSLNRNVALQHVRRLCLSIVHNLINT